MCKAQQLLRALYVLVHVLVLKWFFLLSSPLLPSLPLPLSFVSSSQAIFKSSPQRNLILMWCLASDRGEKLECLVVNVRLPFSSTGHPWWHRAALGDQVARCSAIKMQDMQILCVWWSFWDPGGQAQLPGAKAGQWYRTSCSEGPWLVEFSARTILKSLITFKHFCFALVPKLRSRSC